MSMRRLFVAGLFLATAVGPIFAARVARAAPPAASKKGVPADEVVDEAQRAGGRGDWKTAVELLEKALKIEPDNRRGLLLLAVLNLEHAEDATKAEGNAMFLRSAAAMRALRDAYKKDLAQREKDVLAVALYAEARAFALDAKAEKAIDSLGESIDAGLDQVELLDEDEFAALRKSPRFQAIRARAEAKAIADARAEAKEQMAKAKPFPFDFKLPDLNDKAVALADLKGKVAIVDIWGTWCPPCRMELPHLVKLYKKYHDKGLEIVGINFERADTKKEIKELIRAAVKEFEIPYPCLVGDEKMLEQVPGFEGFPTMIFLDRSGKVRLAVGGYHSLYELDAIVAMLLEEKAEKAAE